MDTCKDGHTTGPRQEQTWDRAKVKKWAMTGNECGASTQIISHMMGLVRVYCD